MNTEELNELSDFEINRLVADALNLKWNVRVIMIDCCDVFDPCNNWEDAGPIIYENSICLDCEKDSMCYASTTGHTVEHKNPLRAAMMCFLMMRSKQ